MAVDATNFGHMSSKIGWDMFLDLAYPSSQIHPTVLLWKKKISFSLQTATFESAYLQRILIYIYIYVKKMIC